MVWPVIGLREFHAHSKKWAGYPVGVSAALSAGNS